MGEQDPIQRAIDAALLQDVAIIVRTNHGREFHCVCNAGDACDANCPACALITPEPCPRQVSVAEFEQWAEPE